MFETSRLLGQCHALKITANAVKIIAYFLPVFSLFYIYKYGVNVVQLDEFSCVDLFNDKVDFWSYLLKPNNEHVIPLGKLEYYLIGSLTSMNSKALMYVNVLTLWIPYFFLVRKIEMKSGFVAIIVVLLFYLAFFSPIAWQNLLWGFQLLFLSAYSFAVLAMLMCDEFLRTNKIRYLFIASCCCFVASFNSSHGILSWVSIFIVMIYSKQYKKCLLPMLPMFFVVAFYLVILKGVVHATHGNGEMSVIDIFKFFLTFIASSIWSFMDKYGWVIGGLLLVTLGCLMVFKKFYKNYLITTLTIFGLLIAASVTFGRWWFGVNYAYQSRYFQLQMPLYLALFIIVLNNPNKVVSASINQHGILKYTQYVRKFISLAAVLAFLSVFIYVSESNLKLSAELHPILLHDAEVLRTFDKQPKNAYALPYDYVKERVDLLKSKKLNMFSGD